jgi:hypothetical protein
VFVGVRVGLVVGVDVGLAVGGGVLVAVFVGEVVGVSVGVRVGVVVAVVVGVGVSPVIVTVPLLQVTGLIAFPPASLAPQVFVSVSMVPGVALLLIENVQVAYVSDARLAEQATPILAKLQVCPMGQLAGPPSAAAHDAVSPLQR